MFQIFHDSNGNSISLTSTHLIKLDERGGYVSAGSIKLGDMLRIYSKKEATFVNFEVKRIEFEMKMGFTAPLTQEGTILVNGVDASCYAQVNSHYLADLAMTPVKLWFKAKQFLFSRIIMTNENNENNVVDIDSYSIVLYKVASIFFNSYLI